MLDLCQIYLGGRRTIDPADARPLVKVEKRLILTFLQKKVGDCEPFSFKLLEFLLGSMAVGKRK